MIDYLYLFINGATRLYDIVRCKMRRLYCPWCNQLVNTNSADLIKCVNGRGIYKTEIYAHRSCYERRFLKNEVKDTGKNN